MRHIDSIPIEEDDEPEPLSMASTTDASEEPMNKLKSTPPNQLYPNSTCSNRT